MATLSENIKDNLNIGSNSSSYNSIKNGFNNVGAIYVGNNLVYGHDTTMWYSQEYKSNQYSGSIRIDLGQNMRFISLSNLDISFAKDSNYNIKIDEYYNQIPQSSQSETPITFINITISSDYQYDSISFKINYCYAPLFNVTITSSGDGDGLWEGAADVPEYICNLDDYYYSNSGTGGSSSYLEFSVNNNNTRKAYCYSEKGTDMYYNAVDKQIQSITFYNTGYYSIVMWIKLSDNDKIYLRHIDPNSSTTYDFRELDLDNTEIEFRGTAYLQIID